MNDITNTKTADLIAELRELEKNAKVKPVSLEDVYARQSKAKRHSEICYELDRRATDAGIAIYENQFVYNTTEFWITHTRNLEHDIMTLAANGNITAKEQHDLEAWLLLKEGGRDA